MSEADRYFIKKGFSKVIKQGIEEFTDDDGNYIHFDLVIERFTCNCYLSAKELQAINKKVEELRMDMSNKTSDKNVANIEDDVNELKSIMNLRTESGFAYSQKNTLKLQKSIRNVLAEREQDKKRIQELKEENKKLKAQHIFTRNKATNEEKAELYDVINKTIDTFLEKEKPIWQQEMTTDKMSLEEAINIVDTMYQDRYKIIQENDTVYVDRLNDVRFTNLEFASVILLREVQSLQNYLENSIPKQAVIETLNRHKLAYEEFNKMYNNTYYEDDEKRARDFYMIVTEDRIVQVLTKLLGGEK